MNELVAEVVAEKALTRITSHEIQCAERWAEARDFMKNLNVKFDRILWTCIALLASMVGALVGQYVLP